MKKSGRRLWVEIALVAPATAIFGPMLALGLFGMAITLIFSSKSLTASSLSFMGLTGGMAIAGLAGWGSSGPVSWSDLRRFSVGPSCGGAPS